MNVAQRSIGGHLSPPFDGGAGSGTPLTLLATGRAFPRNNWPRRVRTFESSCVAPSRAVHRGAACGLAGCHLSPPRASAAGANWRCVGNPRPDVTWVVIQICRCISFPSHMGVRPGGSRGYPIGAYARLVQARRDGFLSSRTGVSSHFAAGLDSGCDSLVWRWRSCCNLSHLCGLFLSLAPDGHERGA